MRSFSIGGALSVLIGAGIIGFASVLVKSAEAGPHASAFWRLTLALPALATLLAVESFQKKIA